MTSVRTNNVNSGQSRPSVHKLRNGFVSAVLIGAITVAAILTHQRIQEDAASAIERAALSKTPTAVSVRTEVARAENTFELPRRFVGLIVPQRTVSLGFEINGRVASIAISTGDRVKQGDVLATLDRRRIEASLAEARAGLERAKAVLTLKKAEVARNESLHSRGVTAQRTLDETRSDLQTARADVASAEARIRSLEIDLADTALRAPFDGQIISVDFDLGDVVSPGRTILTVSTTGQAEAHIGVPVLIAEEFTPGDLVTVRHRGRPLEGIVQAVVSRVNTASQTLDLVVVLPAGTVAIDGERIALVTRQVIQQSGFWIPLGAMVSDLKGLFAVQIAVATEGKRLEIARAPVTVHFTDGERAFVSGALRDGDRIVTEGTNRVSPGQTVVLASREAKD